MKIGILTFHCADNYGAVLQCYALQETLKTLGHEVEIINYRPQYLIKPYKIFSKERIKSKNIFKSSIKFAREILTIHRRKELQSAFKRFRTTFLHISSTILQSHNNISPEYDIYIVGSDQIWNTKITNKLDPIYFGKFNIPKYKKRCISYAASMEVQGNNIKNNTILRSLLKNLDAISVRENNLAHTLEPLTNKKIYTVLDPTLLAPEHIWSKLIVPIKLTRPYILIYQVRKSPKTQIIARNLAIQLGCEVFEISTNIKNIIRPRRTIEDASPEKFISLIKYARCIVTTSFHGTAFSIIFKKDFYCLKLEDGFDSRSKSLLEDLNLSERFISCSVTPTFSKVIYDSKIENKIKELRSISIKYLSDNLINPQK